MSRHTGVTKRIKQQTQIDLDDGQVDQDLIQDVVNEFGGEVSRLQAIRALKDSHLDFDGACEVLDAEIVKRRKKQEKKVQKQEKNEQVKVEQKKGEEEVGRREKERKGEEEKREEGKEERAPSPVVRKVSGSMRKHSTSQASSANLGRKASHSIQQIDNTHYNCQYPKVNDQPHKPSQTLSIVVIGHVDSGKSTLVGRLLQHLGEVSKKQLHKNQKQSKQMNKQSFKYAWVTDQTQLQRQKGITIDVGLKSVKLQDKTIVFLDSPGHKEYIPNMISGAVQADYAVLVVDVSKFQNGFKYGGGQTKEHAYIVRALGVASIIVAINKMDLAEWKEEVYQTIKAELLTYLIEIGFQENKVIFVPISAFMSVNLVERKELAYYKGPSLIQIIQDLDVPPRPADRPFRLKITNVYESYTGKLKGHCLAGKIEGGVVKKDDKMIILPQNCQCIVKQVLLGQDKVKSATVGDHIDCQIKLLDQTFFQVIKPGNVLSSIQYSIPVANRLVAQILTFQLDVPLLSGTQVIIFLGASECTGRITKILKIFDSKNRNTTVKQHAKALKSNQCCEVELTLSEKVCVELFSNFKAFGRVILRANYATVAVGIVKSILPDK